jgi:hypothetical protein
MAIRLIPVEPYPDTTQQCDLDGVTYSLHFRWNQRDESWHLDLSTLDGTPIAMGLKLVTRFPLLRRNLHPSRPPGELLLLDAKDQDAPATLEEFGGRFGLYYVEASGVDG